MSQPPNIPADVPMAEPVYEAAHAYTPLPPPRPGVVTTLGIMSIVFAIAEVGWAIVLGIILIFYLFVAAISGVSRYTASHQYTGGVYFPDGLPALQTSLLTNHLTEVGSLSPARHDSLEALLTKSGQTVAPTMLNSDQSPEAIAKIVSGHGKTAEGNDFFQLSEGRVELHDDSATFERAGTSEVIVATIAETHPTIEHEATSSPAPAPTSAPAAKSRESLVLLTGITAGLGVVLAIVLFVAGISTLRGRRVAGSMLRWWAWLRLPLCVLSTIATMMLFGSFPEADNNSGTPVDPVDVAGWMILGAIPGVVVLVYLIVVLLILRTRSAKDWFARA